MTFPLFLKQTTKLLPPYINDIDKRDIYSRTKDYLDRYIRLIVELDDFELSKFSTSKRQLENKVEADCDIILKALELSTSNKKACNELIFNHFFNPECGAKNYYWKPIKERMAIYRMRKVEKLDDRLNVREMFHIPFEKSNITSNQRYSSTGRPFLYAGTSIDVCWVELGQPSLREFNVSALGLEYSLNLFDMTYPEIINKIEDLLRFPLIIACSLPSNPDSTDKPEYIIPQAVLSGINQFNLNIRNYYPISVPRSTPIPYIDGIIYLSSHIAKMNLDEINVDDYHNLVFVTQLKEEGLCEELCKKLFISEPVNIKFMCDLINQQSHNIVDPCHLENENSDPTLYFKKIEECLRSRYCKKHQLNPM